MVMLLVAEAKREVIGVAASIFIMTMPAATIALLLESGG